MGAKVLNEIPDRLKDNVTILKCILQELRLMRQDLRLWMDADVKNHYEKDVKHTKILEELVVANGNGLRKVEPV